ncbi:MAG: carbohydate-binding domain-containing protein, partial [Bacteroidota bacterium]
MRTAISICTLLLLVACQPNQKPLTAESLAISWEMGENNYQKEGGGGFISSFVITNKGQSDLPASGWSIYFNFARLINSESVTGGIAIRHINGDFYELSPTSNFK